MVKSRTHASDRSGVASLKNLVVLKHAVVVSYGNLNFRQMTSHELLIVPIFCVETLFNLFSPTVVRIIRNVLLKFSPL